MDEAEAKARLDVPRETLARLEAFVDMLRAENAHQNLVSKSSLDQVWSRHILDSAQLIRFAPETGARWIDLGSGAGLPGLVVAMLHRSNVVLVEPRPGRAHFLAKTVHSLGLDSRVTLIADKAKAIPPAAFEVISARAFAPLGRLFAEGLHLAGPGTVWILPKGRGAKSELEAARASWQGDFALEPSVTDGDARILVARNVHRATRSARGIAANRPGMRAL